MNRTKVLGLVGLFTSATLIVTSGTEREAVDTWKQAVSTNDFKKTLAAVKALQEEWPAIHSVKHVINKDGEKALLQTGYRDIAKVFWQGLECYEKELRDMPPEAFCEGADALLEARKQFLKHPSYVNYFLVDSINRVIYVNLGERLAKEGDLPACYDKIVERLAEFRCDWSLFYELANWEYGSKQISRAEIENLSLDDRIKAIEKMIGQEQTFLVFPQDFHNVYGLRIFEKRSSEAWLARLAMSDHAIGAFLPALLSYRRKTTNFSPTDSFPKILAVLENEPPLNLTLLYSQPSAAREVDRFLRGLQSKNWRLQLSFSDPPGFTEERIEWCDEQEIERKAKREAQREADQVK